MTDTRGLLQGIYLLFSHNFISQFRVIDIIGQLSHMQREMLILLMP